MAESKRVVVTGATGLLGKRVCGRLEAKGYRVVVFSRNPERARRTLRYGAEFVKWNAEESGPWAEAIDGAHAVIHLAGANLFARRWTAAYKKEIMESRELGTRGIVNAMREATNKPHVFISSSAQGYYGSRDDTLLDEDAAPGDDFLARVVRAWEDEAAKAEGLGIRTVLVRTGVVLNDSKKALPLDFRHASLSRPGVVLDTDAGALPLMTIPFRFFAGGPIGSGKQWFSWIHVDDEIGLIIWALENDQVRGPINAVAPEPMTNKEFSKMIGRVVDSPSWMPVPGFALRIMLGEFAEMLTEGQRVSSKKVQELGYTFKYPTAESALRDLLRK